MYYIIIGNHIMKMRLKHATYLIRSNIARKAKYKIKNTQSDILNRYNNYRNYIIFDRGKSL